MADNNTQIDYPYVSYPTFKAFIGYLHETAVTDMIDNTMMPPSMSGSSRSHIMAALKSIGLIDGNCNTQQGLKELVTAYNSKNWPDAIKKWVLKAYDDIIGDIDLAKATRRQINEIFKDVPQQTRERYIRFFLTANKEAGVEYSPHIKIRNRKSNTKTKKRSGVGSTKKSKQTGDEPSAIKHHEEKKPAGAYELPLPIEADFRCFIRIPMEITPSQVELVKAVFPIIEAMAKQNEMG